MPDHLITSLTASIALLPRVFHLTFDLETNRDVLDVSNEKFHLGEEKRVVKVTFILSNIITDDDPFVLLDALWPNSILRTRITRPSCIFSHHNRM
jgi:hypothetical protein